MIDGDGVVRWSYVSPIKVNPGADGILAALEDLRKERGDVSTTGWESPRSPSRSTASATTSRARPTRR